MPQWYFGSDKEVVICSIHIPERVTCGEQVDILIQRYGITDYESQSAAFKMKSDVATLLAGFLGARVNPEGAYTSDKIVADQFGGPSGIHGVIHMPDMECHLLLHSEEDYGSLYRENQIMLSSRVPPLGRKCCERDAECVNALARAISI